MSLKNIPLICGTYKVNQESLNEAIKQGYFAFDTANAYKNAKILRNIIDDKMFIITKFAPEDFDKDISVVIENHTEELGRQPNVVLIHSPLKTDNANIKAFTNLRKHFPSQLIGISNFSIKEIQALIEANCKPDIISLEIHPFYQPNKLINYCNNQMIPIIGYRCLSKGAINNNETIQSIAKKYGAKPSQIVLRWIHDKNIIPIVSSSNQINLHENLQYGGIVLTNEDRILIDNLNKGPDGATCMLRYCQHDD